MLSRFREDELIQLTDQDGSGSYDANRVRTALDDAAALIDAHLAARYQLPLQVVPRFLVNLHCDLAREALYEDRITDHVQKRADAARTLLRDIGAGKMSLGPDNAGVVQQTNPANGPASVEVVSGGRVFTPDSLADYTRQR
ncbi:MAG: DUF1320 domain-containing protein [Burkholderiales bacterium]|nr:DUF1320 domain-containing protein [Burkholderiales bacterium]